MGGPGILKLPSEVLKKLGVLKNELLIFTILAALIINAFAYTLHGGPAWQAACAVAMHFLGIVFLSGFGFLYVYASLYLPSSQQELEFSRAAEHDLREHRRRKLKPQSSPPDVRQ